MLERQYAKYFDLDITEKLKEETESTKSHNVDAEEIMGMFSSAKQIHQMHPCVICLAE